MSDAVLAWRIPEGHGRTSLRFALTQIAFVSVVVGLLIVFLAASETHTGLLTATIVIAVALAAIQIFRAWQAASGPPNVWLDDAGLHWRDRQGGEQLLPHDLVRGFIIGHDHETRRNLASLTLLLEGDFLSQPIELHAPADEAAVRQWLRDRWSQAEANAPVPHRRPLKLHSEFDFQRQFWLLEGERMELEALAQTWFDAAKVALPPLGGRPKQWELDFDSEPLTLAIAPHTWLDSGYLSATPETLRHLAGEVVRHLQSDKPPPEFEIPLTTDSGHHWRILVAVVSE